MKKLKIKLINLLSYIINLLQRVQEKLNVIDNISNFDDLTPRNDVEDNVYSNALKWALDNPNIKNIALTGPYGSGKSSILRTYEKKDINHTYLRVSLASFSKYVGDNENSEAQPDNDVNDLIERSILQQMIYRVKKDTVPYSRFKRINNSSTIKIIIKLFLFFLWIGCGVVLYKPEIINDIKNNINKMSEFNILPYSSYIFVALSILFILITIGFIITIFSFLKKLNLSKIKFLNGEIELGNDSETSILNKHLDEILYFFEVTDYDVVIIEDLDRFNSTKIFSKLRELNSFINNYEKIKRRVVFIYAIRDDMFNKKDRTKFFDFIIPVIPIVNSSNSEGILLKKMENDNLIDYFSDRFVSDITLYIDDMRLLSNIYNEFKIYKEKLSDIKLNLENLFSIIVYKNLYPEDFSKLQYMEGMVYEVFKNKDKYKKEKINEIESEIKKINEKIIKIDKEMLGNIEELRSVYIEALIEKIPGAISIKVDNKKVNISALKTKENFNKLKGQTNIGYYNIRNIYTNSGISFTDLEDYIENEMTYDEREEIIRQKQSDEKENLKNEINKLNIEKNKIKSSSLKNIIDKKNYNKIFNEKIQQEKLLVFLLRNGYIDEMHQSYISYFYPGSLTAEDMAFIFSIKNQEALNFDYSISNKEKIIRKIHAEEFERKEVLNYDLVDYIIENISLHNNYKLYYQLILSQLSDKSEKSIEFIDGFKEVTQNKEFFIKTICKEWTNMWIYLEKESNFPVNKLDEYLVDIIKYADIEDIIKIDHNSVFSNYISGKTNFLTLIKESNCLDKVKDVITELNIKFIDLEILDEVIELFRFIYDNNHYQINEKMIETVLINIGEVEKPVIEVLKKSNYTTLKGTECKCETANYSSLQKSNYSRLCQGDKSRCLIL